MEGREYFTIDQIRAVEIINSLEELEAERDRMKEKLDHREKWHSSMEARIKELEADYDKCDPNSRLDKLRKQLQARDDALEKAKEAFHWISRYGHRHIVIDRVKEAIRAIEASQGEEKNV